MITERTSIEELVESYPASVGFLRLRNIACIVCGEPVWGDLGELLSSRNLEHQEAAMLIEELNRHCLIQV